MGVHLYPMSFLNKGVGCHGPEPMSLERLQVCYSADERRVIHDAVVSAVPSCHDLADLALLRLVCFMYLMHILLITKCSFRFDEFFIPFPRVSIIMQSTI